MDDPMDKDFDAPQSNSAVSPITDDGMGQYRARVPPPA
jgi:hypothetical protein